MLEWTGAQNVRTYLLLTKVDKLSKSEAITTMRKVRAEVGEAVGAQLFSAVTKAGVDEARKEVLRMLSAAPARAVEPVEGA
jgi:GTP-binding protein